MKILIADKVSAELIRELEALGAEVVCDPDLKADSLPEAIGDAAVLVVRSTKVTADTIRAASHLRLIVRAGAGVNTIDLDAASDLGIYVANCPGMNTDAVAELAIGLLICADRGIADATQALRAGQWQKKRFGKACGLKGRTLGIVGVGQIGLAVAKRAKGLDMKVAAWSRSLTPERAEALGLEYAATPVELAAQSDAVSVHLALTSETKGMISNDFFDAMKPGAIFLNTSRGDTVDTDALIKAISEKELRVGVDVFASEPAGGEAPFEQTELASLVACTPHIGASTDQAAEAIAAEVLRIVRIFSETGQPPNVVNMRRVLEPQTNLIVRHYNRVGVLARVLDSLRNEGINIEEMQNSIFQTDQAASCSLTLDKPPTSAALETIMADEDVIEVTL
jgi:D-3-phosphoglycerate dehydrogenase / 2-oxoglutarate reductase